MKPKLYLAIKGFRSQKITSKHIQVMLRQVPLTHLEGLQSIVYSPRMDFIKLGVQVPLNCKGAYYPEYRAVVLHQLESYDEVQHVLLHEIGHYVFYSRISSFIRKEWVQNFSSYDAHVSEYARENASEDFAESYAFYAANNLTKFNSVSKKLSFLRYKVFVVN
ncbi:hypothetical protein [Catenovulum sediminis]|uniref:hypothetical protein n=1 Tax=Catenovulum sediminis TaxID=1740262 RepID=UPI00117DBF2A|nr:hypothetical protein [Catenovulum sediminis]